MYKKVQGCSANKIKINSIFSGFLLKILGAERNLRMIDKTKMLTRSPAVARLGHPYHLYSKASVRLPVTERNQFPRVSTVLYMLYGDAAVSNAIINVKIQYSK